MSGLYDDAFIEALRQGALGVAGDWGLSPRTDLRLLAISENATFLATEPERDRQVVLRVHRPAYHTPAEIRSEIAWIEALRAEEIIETPEPLARRAGGHLARFTHGAATRHVAAFAFMDGTEPAADAALTADFARLGAISARLHGHALRWTRPAGFIRKTWNFDTTLGPTPHWGDWRAARGLTPEGTRLLLRCTAQIAERLRAFGTGPARFGLIHADLRLANLLADGPRLGVIDFDDCGFGWFVYDFAAAVSFLEQEPYIPDLAAAWAQGYRTVAPLMPEDEAMIETFVMLRRLLLTAWVASHAETPTAAAVGPGYTDGTVALAERYLTA